MVFGVASQVEGLVARMIAELGAEPGRRARASPRATSRRSSLDECRCFTAPRCPHLTLRGLELAFARNA